MNKKEFRYPFECPECGSWDTHGVWIHRLDNDMNDRDIVDCYEHCITKEVVYDSELTTNESICNQCGIIYNY